MKKTLPWLFLICAVALAVCYASILSLSSHQKTNPLATKGDFPLELKWQFNTEHSITAGLAVGDGEVVIRTEDKLYTLDVLDGQELWSTDIESDRFHSTPLIKDGLVVVANNDRMIAYDAKTGSSIWTAALVSPCQDIQAIPVTLDKKVVYMVKQTCYVRAYDRNTGALIWQSNLPGARSLVDLFLAGDRVYLVIDFATVQIRDALTGALIKEIKGTTLDGPSIYHSGILYGVYHHSLAAYDIQAENILWKSQPEQEFWDLPPLVAGNQLILPPHDGYPQSFDIRSGELLWTAATNRDTYQFPAIIDDTVYMRGAHNGIIYALSIENGMELGQLHTGGHILISDNLDLGRPMAEENRLLFTVKDRVYAYGEK